MQKNDILCLDEATSNLDDDTSFFCFLLDFF